MAEKDDDKKKEEPKHVERVSVKPPSFWDSEPALWFAVIESQFELANVKIDTTKFYTVVAHLDSKALKVVRDIVTKPPDENKYDAIKNALVSRLTESEGSKLQKLLRDIDLGDRKPSQLLREMQDLASSHEFPLDVLKQLWLQRLPQNVQAILAISSETLDQQALIADKIVDTLSSQVVGAINRSDSVNPDAKYKRIIDDLQSQIRRLKQSRSPSRNNSSRHRSQSPSGNKSQKPLVCWYHFRFADKAKKCVGKCTFNKSEN